MLINDLVLNLAQKKKINKEVVEAAKRVYLKGSSGSETLRSSDILHAYRNLLKTNKVKPSSELEKALQLKNIRSSSGVAVVTVLTKPWVCPGSCIFCPNEEGMPKSYLSSEPAAMRAKQKEFNPFSQVTTRLQQYRNIGHPIDKIELIILGGSFTAYPFSYQKWFIEECFRACNEFENKSKPVGDVFKYNEIAKNRIVFLSIETRPDLVTEEVAVKLRELGVTKVELGVQTLQENVLKLCERGHGVLEVVAATQILKSLGFKICYHIMPGLPGSSPAKDLEDFKLLFSDPRFQPDMLKIYPVSVLPGTVLHFWYQSGKYKPYTHKQLFNLLLRMKQAVPQYTRINRLIRDIPEFEITAGSKRTDLRQSLQKEMKKQAYYCKCIRCREIRLGADYNESLSLEKIEYDSLAGKEIFMQYVDSNNSLYGMLRLLLPKQTVSSMPFLRKSALIRELHIFGIALEIGVDGKNGAQHKGLGKKLLKEAETIALGQGYNNITVISGVGVRDYYRKLGYYLRDTYMVKKLGVESL